MKPEIGFWLLNPLPLPLSGWKLPLDGMADRLGPCERATNTSGCQVFASCAFEASVWSGSTT